MKLIVPMDSNDAMAAALGRLVARWGILESNLISVLDWLLQVDQTRARLIFNTFPALGQKLQLIERLAHIYVADEGACKKLVGLVHRTQSLSNDRNKFIHAIWGAGKPPGLTLLSSVLPQNRERLNAGDSQVTPQDMNTAGDKVSELALEVQDFSIAALKIPVSRVPLG